MDLLINYQIIKLSYRIQFCGNFCGIIFKFIVSYIHWNLVHSVTSFIVRYYFYAFLRFKTYIIYNLEAFTFCTLKYTMNVFVMSTIYHSNIQRCSLLHELFVFRNNDCIFVYCNTSTVLTYI